MTRGQVLTLEITQLLLKHPYMMQKDLFSTENTCCPNPFLSNATVMLRTSASCHPDLQLSSFMTSTKHSTHGKKRETRGKEVECEKPVHILPFCFLFQDSSCTKTCMPRPAGDSKPQTATVVTIKCRSGSVNCVSYLKAGCFLHIKHYSVYVAPHGFTYDILLLS